MQTETESISIDDAQALIYRALIANDVGETNARSVACALVAAEVEGQVGHGFSRLADYVAQVKSGKVRANAEPQLRKVNQTTLLVDAGFGFAYPALDRAIHWGSSVARSYGCCVMLFKNSHHCGALSVHVERIALKGFLGLMVANAPAAIAPWGSHKPLFGTNPIAFAAPRKNAAPLVIDLSLSRVARGKVMHAKKSGQPIPEGWALDRDGQPTSDPVAALQGSMLPIGEAKGTALALIVEILASVLPGANISTQVSSYFTADGPPPGSGQFLMALRPPNAGFTDRLESLLGLIEGLDGARLPVRRRAETLAQARENGIKVPRCYLDEARTLAAAND